MNKKASNALHTLALAKMASLEHLSKRVNVTCRIMNHSTTSGLNFWYQPADFSKVTQGEVGSPK